MLTKQEEEEQWGFSTAEAAALAIDEVAQLRSHLVALLVPKLLSFA